MKERAWIPFNTQKSAQCPLELLFVLVELLFRTLHIGLLLILLVCNRALSDIPMSKPIAGVRVGLVDDEFLVNPTNEEMERSSLDMIIAGTANAVLMIEVSYLY